jgi:hypothetical protein
VAELTTIGRNIISDTFMSFEIWFTIAAVYMVLTLDPVHRRRIAGAAIRRRPLSLTFPQPLHNKETVMTLTRRLFGWPRRSDGHGARPARLGAVGTQAPASPKA